MFYANARFAFDAVLILLLVIVSLGVAYSYGHRARIKKSLDEIAASFPPTKAPDRYPFWRLFFISFAALYVEIMMIRWIGTEVRVFAYFQNLALIACFLGFGVGCFRSKVRKPLLLSLWAMAILIALVHFPLTVWQNFLTGLSTMLSLSPDAALWGVPFPAAVVGHETLILFSVSSIVILTILLLLLIVTMIPMGQYVGHYLDTSSHTITAYTVNLIGSVAGIWVFAGLSFYCLPPEFWFGVAFSLLLALSPRSLAVARLGIALLLISLFFLHLRGAGDAEVHWSPYQKIAVEDKKNQQYDISVNNTGYMTIGNTTTEFLSKDPALAGQYHDYSSYDAPFRFAKRTDHVLIVGAGAGNDAAAALRHGAGEVDAVEIDPIIYSLGKRLHPDHPYDSPRVRVILNDARAYLRRTQQQYDVVIFGLLDSHTQFSDFSNMRIDNYVYTEESFREAKRLLAPGGIMVVKFEVRAPWTWMGQRFYGMLSQLFDRPPIVFYAPRIYALSSATVFITSNDADLWTRASQARLAALVEKNPLPFALNPSRMPAPATDDWPYVYYRDHTIPRTYLTVMFILMAMTLLLVRGSFEPRQASAWRFFFLGGGFLLLETQLVSRLALYFGTTWQVNCVAITAILIVLMMSNLYVAHFHPSRLAPYFAVLLTSLVANYFYPWESLPYEAHSVGILLSAAYAVPVFCAGIIFTELFRRSERKSNAFGANIVGSVAGGLAQNLSFIFGIRMLLLLAAILYAVAGACGFLGKRQAPALESSVASTVARLFL